MSVVTCPHCKALIYGDRFDVVEIDGEEICVCPYCKTPLESETEDET